MACPYFMPTQKSDGSAWLHPSRLPLGSGWEGHCTAPGHEGAIPDSPNLREGCSLGYATTCPRLPPVRAWDAIRFAVAGENESKVSVAYVCERNHLPAEHGSLEYRVHDGVWAALHPDKRIQKMAECFVESWLRKSHPSTPEVQNESSNEQS